MRTIFHIDFWGKDEGGGMLDFARLEVDLPFSPSIEMEFEHPIWADSRKPIHVSYNIESEAFYAAFERERLDPAHLDDRIKSYVAQGWTKGEDCKP